MTDTKRLHLKGHVALGGLSAKDWPEGPSPLWPWPNLGGIPNGQLTFSLSPCDVAYLSPCDDQGCRAQYQGRWVFLRLGGRRFSGIISRLRKRALRQAWRGGTLRVVMDQPRSRWSEWVLRICLLLLSGGLCWLVVTGVLGMAHLPPGPVRPYALVASLLKLLCVAGTGLVGVVVCWRLLHRARCVHIEVGTNGLCWRTAEGEDDSVDWTAVRGLSSDLSGQAMRIDVANGQRLWIGPLNPRTAAALEVVREELLGMSTPTQRQMCRRLAVVLAVLSGAAAGLAFLLNRTVPVDPGQPGSEALEVIAFLLAVFAAATAASSSSLPRRWFRRLRFRRRRARHGRETAGREA